MKTTFSSKMGKTFIRSTLRPANNKPIEETLQKIKENSTEQKESYRERSLILHGLTCAKCGREFEAKSRHLITVHHKDGDHTNNPPDGSNWENLCVYCHEDEHSRGVLGNYFTTAGGNSDSRSRMVDKTGKEDRNFFSDVAGKENSLAAQLKNILEGKELK